MEFFKGILKVVVGLVLIILDLSAGGFYIAKIVKTHPEPTFPLVVLLISIVAVSVVICVLSLFLIINGVDDITYC